MRKWLTVLMLGAVLSACSASRATRCPPGADPSRNASAVAGRVLIGVAEVLVGADLVDHERDDRGSACAERSDPARTAAASKALEPVAAAPQAVNAPEYPAGAAPVAKAPEHPAGASKTAKPSEPAAGALQVAKSPKRGAAAPHGSEIARPVPAAATTSAAVQARPGRWILVRKHERTLSVFDADRRVKTYAIVLGADPIDPKLYAGDRRTPEGEYHVIGKNVHPQWQRFLLLDYPNPGDRQVYAWRRTKGLVPARGGQVAGTGGAIGIHGTADEALNRSGVNWTYGCISLLSRDIQELYKLVEVGTLVVIEH